MEEKERSSNEEIEDYKWSTSATWKARKITVHLTQMVCTVRKRMKIRFLTVHTISISNLFQALQYHYTLYDLTRIGPVFYGLQYITNASMRSHTTEYNVAGTKPMTSKGMHYAQLESGY